MEAQEEVMGSREQTHIVKGKRTKRQRPQSPIPFAITSNSSSGDGGGGDYSNDNYTNNTILSPATSAAADSTDEEEDMANCLILLAQGQSPEIPNKQIDENIESYKFNSRRYVEAAATETGKAGFYVYECKTCNRTFPSFQALGGHRASHKKLKAMAEEKKQQQLALSDEEEGQFKKNIASFSLQLGNRGSHSSNNKANKIHECSICGAEFTSGQALGGHMRRHRGPMITNTSLSLSPIALEQEEPKKARNVLSLDLNLPAPEDDHRESKFTFAAKQQQQQQQQQQPQQSAPLLFSAATLVDCHY